MPRPEKVQAVAEIKERIEGAQAVFLAEYAGLSVKDQQVLRRSLRENGAEFKVVKMTLARRAADALDIDSLDELLLGPTGLTFADGDPVGVAKVLKDFSKDHAVFQVKGGLLGSDFLTPEKIAELAEIEPREVLLAKLAGAMKAPMANMAGLLAALPRNTASVLQQLLEKKEAAAPAAAATEAPVEDASVDEAPVVDAGAPADDAAADEVPAVDDGAEAAPEAEAATDGEADKTESTEEDSEPTVEASDDADDETKTPADEASDDAEEE
jgi:large subunit ribosomal protein L10